MMSCDESESESQCSQGDLARKPSDLSECVSIRLTAMMLRRGASLVSTAAAGGCLITRRSVQRSFPRAASMPAMASNEDKYLPARAKIVVNDGEGMQFLPRVKQGQIVNDGEAVDITFNDGSAFRFHSFWLRDACRDDNHLLPSMERNVGASPVVAGIDASVKAQSIEMLSGGRHVKVEWPGSDVVSVSSFSALVLRAYAPRVAMALDRECGTWVQPSESMGPTNAWLDPFDSSIEPPRAMDPSSLLFLSNRQQDVDRVPFAPYSWVEDNMEEFLQLITDPGCMIIDGMPEDVACDGSVFSAFAGKYLGGLQKHPLRDTAHWTISTEQSVQISNSSFSDDKEQLAASNSYNTKLQLANHTDQSLYGTPGLFLLFHCAMGEGNNSLVDGFAAAFALRERRPASRGPLPVRRQRGRRLSYYKNGIMSFNVSKPVIQTDANGDPIRIQYHEMYARRSRCLTTTRGSATRRARVQLTHSDEFQLHFKLQKGQMIIMNNWRMMHGRAGLEGKQRIILGGTVRSGALLDRTAHAPEEVRPLDVRGGRPPQRPVFRDWRQWSSAGTVSVRVRRNGLRG